MRTNGKLYTQQPKSWHLSATRVLVMQQQIFIKIIHIQQVESYS